jgi:ribose-phosphate pyrophosphokinase
MSELQFIESEGTYAPQSVNLAQYPDTMPLVRELPLSSVNSVMLRPKSLSSFVAGMFWLDAIRERFGYLPHLVLPFLPGARQDRLNSTGDVLFTAKSVATMINARGLKSVTVLDPHSEVMPGLIDRCRVVHAAACISPPLGKYAAVIAPDAGAEKRAALVARNLGLPLIHAWKTRDVKSGAIAGFGTESFRLSEKARLLVVDDICDGGGTFTGLAKALNYEGRYDLHLFVTHGIFSQGTSELKKHYSHLYCTDSILGTRDGVIEINVCDKLLTKGHL